MKGLPLKPFHLMTPEDYAEIGFKSGLEVHQQLFTRTKLFCRCPAGQYSKEYDAEILREMRPTLSEMGEYDGTALMEKKTRKIIYYRMHHQTVCTYEFDDTPPFQPADDAIDIAIELALLLRLNTVNELHIARKQYLDGSIPTGFQRTTILGVDGWMPYKDRRIKVRQLGLEEDSCREVSDRGHDRVYLTDRLGMPLIEVVTEAEMRTPQEVAEVCNLIRKICRSTQKVRRGYGATRQDVNVSVTGGTRVEIKGVPQIWRIPRLVYNEASRQVALLRIREMLRERGVTPTTFEARHQDVTDGMRKATYAPVKQAVQAGRFVRCVLLRGFAGLMNETTQEYTTFFKEFSDRVRVIACLTDLPNIACSSVAGESLRPEMWAKLRRKMRAADNDELVLTWGNQRDVTTAAEEIIIRAREATQGVPNDTRQPYKDGTTGFERVLPGAERMYPDTDLPPIKVEAERIERIRAQLPEDVWVTEERFLQAGVTPYDAERLCIWKRAPLVTRLIEELRIPGRLIATVLGEQWRRLSRLGLNPERLSDGVIVALFEMSKSGRIPAEALPLVMRWLLEDSDDATIDKSHLEQLVADRSLQPVDEARIDTRIAAVLDETNPDDFPGTDAVVRHVTGSVMHPLLGKVSGKDVARRVAKIVEAAASLRGEEVKS
jgi:glutamyl-tRNA(Gln) amidotransferase subunit E